jgi:hypothetical protein
MSSAGSVTHWISRPKAGFDARPCPGAVGASAAGGDADAPRDRQPLPRRANVTANPPGPRGARADGSGHRMALGAPICYRRPRARPIQKCA